jgi:anti-anti-sigma factor
MTARGQITVREVDGVPVVEGVGEIDLTNAHEFEAILNQAAKVDRGRVIISLSRVTYLDSQGIRVLFAVGERLSTMRQRLLIVAPTGGSPRRILEISGADSAFPIFDTVETAISAP